MGWLSDDDRNTPQGIQSQMLLLWTQRDTILVHMGISPQPHATSRILSVFPLHLRGSLHEILICDIQGVGDLYTDPQVNSGYD